MVSFGLSCDVLNVLQGSFNIVKWDGVMVQVITYFLYAGCPKQPP